MSGARASFYRPTGQSRRTVRNQQQFDHDVFEGLPIRRWNKQWMWFAKKNVPPPPPPELPLPKETHLLTPMSQTLLKAARNGTLGKPQEEDPENSAEKKPAASTRLFMTNKWTVIPREEEPAEPEYLGRPPDTFSRHSRLVRKTVNGKVMIVEEELEELYPEVSVPGIAIDGVAASPAQPIKRRPPPPKRKPGRGRKPGFKKMVTFSEDGRALPTGEGHATPSGATGNGGEAEGEGDGEGEGEDDVEMGDAEDGTPDDQDNDGEDGEGENDIEVTPMEKTATPEVAAAHVKKEGTVEPMDVASPAPAAATIPPIAEAVEEKIESPTPAAPAAIKEPTPEQTAPAEIAEVPSDTAPEPVPAPVVEAPASVVKSPTPPQASTVEEEENAASPSVNPLKRKSPSDEGEGELIDKDLVDHEVSIAAAVAERESHDETLSPAPPAPPA
ncbi:hypothetical protein TWF281_002630 [Arthrobotrys megalospora]